MQIGDRLTLIERRRLGLTIPNILDALRAIELADYIDEDENIDVGNLTVAVAGYMAFKKEAEWQEETSVDWEKVLEWIETVLELLIKYLPILLDLFKQAAEARLRVTQ